MTNCLPDELLLAILRGVPKDDLLEMRLTSRSFCRVATELYFSQTKVIINEGHQLMQLCRLFAHAGAATLPIHYLVLDWEAWKTHNRWFNDKDIQMLGRVTPYLSHVRSLCIRLPEEMIQTLNCVKWGAFRQFFTLPRLYQLKLYLPYTTMLPNYPLPSTFSPHLTNLHLGGHFDLRAILMFVEHLHELKILHVDMYLRINLDEQLLDKIANERRHKISQNRRVQVVSLSLCVRDPQAIHLMRLLFFFFYVTPCLSTLFVYVFADDLVSGPLDPSTQPFDAINTIWTCIGFPRSLCIINDSEYSPSASSSNLPVYTETRQCDFNLEHVALKVNPLVVFPLLSFLPRDRIASLVFDYPIPYDGDERVWPNLFRVMPSLPLLKSLRVGHDFQDSTFLDADDLSALVRHDTLTQLTMAEIAFDSPATFETFLHAFPQIRQVTLHWCFCMPVDEPGLTAMNNPIALKLRSVYMNINHEIFERFHWWPLPVFDLQLQLYGIGYAMSLHIVLQDPLYARGASTRVWVLQQAADPDLKCYELNTDEVQRLFTVRDNPPAGFFEFVSHMAHAESHPTFYHAAHCLLQNHLSVYCCQSLEYCTFTQKEYDFYRDFDIQAQIDF
ncbi:hypothetical protein BC940DRAFT_330647 [Gongronella butleri]|nr:hypothetical protein BC940DRAFT_330647 [Gongronella butleri]